MNGGCHGLVDERWYQVYLVTDKMRTRPNRHGFTVEDLNPVIAECGCTLRANSIIPLMFSKNLIKKIGHVLIRAPSLRRVVLWSVTKHAERWCASYRKIILGIQPRYIINRTTDFGYFDTLDKVVLWADARSTDTFSGRDLRREVFGDAGKSYCNIFKSLLINNLVEPTGGRKWSPRSHSYVRVYEIEPRLHEVAEDIRREQCRG